MTAASYALGRYIKMFHDVGMSCRYAMDAHGVKAARLAHPLTAATLQQEVRHGLMLDIHRALMLSNGHKKVGMPCRYAMETHGVEAARVATPLNAATLQQGGKAAGAFTAKFLNILPWLALVLAYVATQYAAYLKVRTMPL